MGPTAAGGGRARSGVTANSSRELQGRQWSGGTRGREARIPRIQGTAGHGPPPST
jgi:hypothetical protein